MTRSYDPGVVRGVPSPPVSKDGEYRDVSLVVPALNEVATIGSVVKSAKEICSGIEIVVVDGDSSDGTAPAATTAGADVVIRHGPNGYGNAIRAGIRLCSRRIVVICDGDGTYDLGILPMLIQQVRDGKVAIARRFHSKPPAMSTIRYVGNVVISMLLLAKGVVISDSQSGLKAFPRSLASAFSEDGMPFSTEVLIRAQEKGLELMEIATREYYIRAPGSLSKLNPLRDGLSIIKFVLREIIRPKSR